MLTDRERIELDAAAIQRELMDIEKQIADLVPVVNEKNKSFQEARAEFEIEKMRLKLLKDRRSSLQTVARTLV